MKISSLFRLGIAPVAGLLLAATPLLGAVYFYEDFDYTVGETLHGKSGGTGFKDGASWTMQNSTTYSHAVISDKTLSYNLGGTLLTSEQSVRVTGIASDTKPFATYQFDTLYNVEEFYVSFLISASTWVPSGGQLGIALGPLATAVNHHYASAGMGTLGSRWQASVGASSPANVFDKSELNETHLIVIRFYKEGETYFNRASIWVDPDSTFQGDPDQVASIGGTKHSTLGFINILNHSSGDADFNIGRIVGGSSWNDVIAPIPEPGTVATLLLGGATACLSLLRTRRTAREAVAKS